jgi:CBS domain-containing protein
MRQLTVGDVMTGEVLSVAYDTPPGEVVAAMAGFDVSAVAVVDGDDQIVGVVTRTDVLRNIDLRAPDRRSRAPWRRPVEGPVWTVRSAGRMMSAPATTVERDATLAQAGRLMRRHAVNRLVVAGPGRRLLGIVTAADLLKIHDRPDEVIRADVAEALATMPVRDLALGVHDGVTTVAGAIPDARTATLVQSLVRGVPGVTVVHNELTVDPPAAAPAAPAERSRPRPADGWWTNRRIGPTAKAAVGHRQA